LGCTIVKIGQPVAAGIISSSESYLSPPSSASSTEQKLPFPSVVFGVLFALFTARGYVATSERRLGDFAE
jgi:hypothetical protein